MSETVSSSANRAYGLARVCRVWQVARSTIYHRRSLPAERQERRPGPVGAATDADLVAEIRAVIETAPFHGEGYRKVWARLRSYARFWVTLPDQAARVSVSRASTPSVNVIPSMTRGNWFAPLRRRHVLAAA